MFDPIQNFDGAGFGDDCDSVAPAMTALFDGEASAAEARRARLHLVVCPQCAQAWRSWQRTRALLQTPVPVPPGLRLRIVLACRLLALRAVRNSSEAAKTSIRSSKEPQNNGVLLPPPSLHDAILQRTTLRDSAGRKDTLVSSSRRSERFAFMHIDWRAPHATVMRFAAATAVPAALLWLSLLSPSQDVTSFQSSVDSSRSGSISSKSVARVSRELQALSIAPVKPNKAAAPRTFSVLRSAMPAVVSPTKSDEPREDKNAELIALRVSTRSERRSAERLHFFHDARPVLIEKVVQNSMPVVRNVVAPAREEQRVAAQIGAARISMPHPSVARAAMTPMMIPVLPVASTRSLPSSETTNDDRVTAPSSDDDTSLHDLADSRPAVVSAVLNNFRDSLLDENSDETATES